MKSNKNYKVAVESENKNRGSDFDDILLNGSSNISRLVPNPRMLIFALTIIYVAVLCVAISYAYGLIL